jgi:hypothetical protein
LCWFAIPSFHEYYSADKDAKAINMRKIESLAKKNFAYFYGYEYSHKQEFKELLKNYPGLNLDLEIKDFIAKFELPSIQLFKSKFDAHCNIVADHLYKCQKHEDLGDQYDQKEILNVVVVYLDPKKLHSDNTEDQISKPILHVCYIKDIETIRNLLICPKCKIFTVQKHRYRDISKTYTM